MEHMIGSVRVNLEIGDITECDTDAIVNAANAQLILGAGVAGAIKRKGGPSIQAECDDLGPLDVGDATITGGGKLKANAVIHAVGPRMGQGNEPALLASATRRALELADENGLESIAFPAISTGVFGYPVKSCAKVMLSTAVEYLTDRETQLRDVRFVLFDKLAYEAFCSALTALTSKQTASRPTKRKSAQ